MKKSILIWAVLLITGFSSALANNDEGVSDRVMNSFKKEFSTAHDIKWETTAKFVKASFTMNDVVMFAYFSEAGELMAVSRNITSNQLPISLSKEVRKNYNEYWITDLFEIAINKETSYYMTVENADNIIVLKAVGTNGWEVYKKDKKEVE